MATQQEIDAVLARVKARNGNEPEFLQAVHEVVESLNPLFLKDAKHLVVFERLCEPERMIMFRVPWVDDKGVEHVNRGYRVQFNSAIGPYKGGLRFHPTVTLSVLKFLGFEQIFKNALTTLPMGGGKGGSDFDPKGKSDREVMRFCHSFMMELHRHVGPNRDVPAGDIGVGGREIGYMFGMYKRLTGRAEGVLTGKGISFGGSLLRPEATGYGAVYFAQNALEGVRGDSLKGKRVLVSGSGNVAQYCVEKLIELGAVPLTMSDSGGYIYEENGITTEKLHEIMELKNVKRARLSEYKSGKYVAGAKPWEIKADIAFPCATQNEINGDEAKQLVANGVNAVFEGANMPTNADGIDVFRKADVLLGPAKAANCGGVSVSGLEMAQNSARLAWTREQVDEKLKHIMKEVFEVCYKTAKDAGMGGDLPFGANVAGFLKVADAMNAEGVV